MKFQLEQIITIKDKAYLLTKSQDGNANFKLCDNSFLGEVGIENWFDVPRAIDDNGNQRMDIFAFVLKHEADKGKIGEGQTLNLYNLYATVVEAFYTVSGKMGSILECGTGMLNIDTVLTDEDVCWKIIENAMPIGRPNDTELQKRVLDNFWFQYFLQPIDHSTKPEVGRRLRIIQNAS